MINKFGKVLESAELKAIGCTEEAINEKYNGSESVFFLNTESGVITETIRGSELVTTYKDVNEFLREFNSPSDEE